MSNFQWPRGTRAALSLSFDDARASQLDNGVPLLDALGVRATFYVMPKPLRERAAEWRAAAERHEIGNHTNTHPCSGNFAFSRHNALEDYTLSRMENELDSAGAAIEEVIGSAPVTFAYPCGQIYVGRGESHFSYVPLIARRFWAGRGYLGESANSPLHCDMALVAASGFDGTTFDELKPRLDNALQNGEWLVLAGHDIGDNFERQAVRPATIEAVCRYAQENGFWIDTVAAVARHILICSKE